MRGGVLSAGGLSTDHFEPSQCSIRALSGKLDPDSAPTAYTLVLDTAWTPKNSLPPAPGSTLGTADQVVPYQCSARLFHVPSESTCSAVAPTTLSYTPPALVRISLCSPAPGLVHPSQLAPSHSPITHF